MGLYHVLVADDKGQLTGASLGPFDNRTVVGMRIKKLLTNDQLLVDQDGERLTVGVLMARRSQPGTRTSDPSSPDSVTSIGNFMPSWVVTHVAPPAHLTPAHQLRGLGELRVQFDVVRLVGPVRQGLSSKDERVKIVHDRVVNLRVRGDRVDVLLLANAAKANDQAPKPEPGEHGSENATEDAARGPASDPACGPTGNARDPVSDHMSDPVSNLAPEGLTDRLRACSIEFLDARSAADFDASLPARKQTVAWPKPPFMSRLQLAKFAVVGAAVAVAAAGLGWTMARRGGP